MVKEIFTTILNNVGICDHMIIIILYSINSNLVTSKKIIYTSVYLKIKQRNKMEMLGTYLLFLKT